MEPAQGRIAVRLPGIGLFFERKRKIAHKQRVAIFRASRRLLGIVGARWEDDVVYIPDFWQPCMGMTIRRNKIAPYTDAVLSSPLCYRARFRGPGEG